MRNVLASSWALLLGFAILMLGDGLQATLLPVRAALEGFPNWLTGLIMSAFYVGFLGGSLYTPKIVERVGHIRVFAAFASLASAAIIVQAVFVTFTGWTILRLCSGFCFAGLYIVAESWLNERATNETRGQLLSFYMVLTYTGVGAGQLLLNLADPLGYELFILTSVLISIAVVPLLLSAGPAPYFAAARAVSLRQLYRISPLGVVAMFGSGSATGAFFGMGPVYAENIGLTVKEISFFMTAAIVGVVIFQWPIGRLSDKFDRRRVLTVVTFIAAAAIVAAMFIPTTSMWQLFAVIALFGGFSLPLYSLAIAHVNDYLDPQQMVAASGALVLANGFGAILGPFSASLMMSLAGAVGLFWTLALIHTAIGVFALYRMLRRQAKPLDQQGPYTPADPRWSPVAGEWRQQGIERTFERCQK
jgi:MFS family permease